MVMNTVINKVSIIGDMVEIEIIKGGELSVVRRNVQGYLNMSDNQKKEVVRDVVGLPYIDFERKPTLVNKILGMLRLKKVV